MFKIFLTLVLFIFATGVVAQEADPTSILPIWVDSIMVFLMGIPKIGPVIVFILKIAGFIAASLTAVVVAIEAVCALLAGTFNMAGATGVAEKIKAFALKITPWLKRFSMHNLQK